MLALWGPVCDILFRDLDCSMAVQPFLREKVERGEVAVKSGQGFYSVDRLPVAWWRSSSTELELVCLFVYSTPTST